MKVVGLINRIYEGTQPKKIRYNGVVMQYNEDMKDYEKYYGDLFFRYLGRRSILSERLNDEVEILEDEEDKDIPLIPDDELWSINGKKGIIEDAHTYSEISKDTAINYNFKVLKEKINQVVEELNRRNNE